MTTHPPKGEEAKLPPHIHFKKGDLLTGSSLIANLKVYKKRTTIKAVQVACPFDVETLEGTMTAKALDWLAVGVNGELYPIAADIFAKTYEAALETSASDARLLEGLREKVEKIPVFDFSSTVIKQDVLALITKAQKTSKQTG